DRDMREIQSLFFEFAHSGDYVLFALSRTERLAAFATSSLGTHSLTCSPELTNDHTSFVLTDRTEDLADKNTARIITAKIRLGYPYNFEALLTKFRENGFRDHQIACQSV